MSNPNLASVKCMHLQLTTHHELMENINYIKFGCTKKILYAKQPSVTTKFTWSHDNSMTWHTIKREKVCTTWIFIYKIIRLSQIYRHRTRSKWDTCMGFLQLSIQIHSPLLCFLSTCSCNMYFLCVHMENKFTIVILQACSICCKLL